MISAARLHGTDERRAQIPSGLISRTTKLIVRVHLHDTRTGYVGQPMDNGLVSCLTDGHPGVSGGGVLDSSGNLVGIPVGRMDGDLSFFIYSAPARGDVPQGS